MQVVCGGQYSPPNPLSTKICAVWIQKSNLQSLVYIVSFKALTLVLLKIQIFSDMMLCHWAISLWCFGSGSSKQ